MTRWSAQLIDDGDRLRTVKLIQLRGERDLLDHERAKLRQDLSVELQRRCRDGRRTPEARALEERISVVNARWLAIISEIRALQQEQAA
jgi:hypothetical protein